MEKVFVACGRKILSFTCLGLMLLAVSPLGATVRLIQFGGAFGFAYSPSSLSVAVGDTIHWTGDFSTHPLSSSTIPSGAASWSCSAGTDFFYVVQKSGQFDYYCTDHGTSTGGGMAGSFTATATAVEDNGLTELPSSFSLAQNFPNPFNPTTVIRFQVPGGEAAGSLVKLKVYDLIGREVATLAEGYRQPGVYEVRWDGTQVPSGSYVYRLQVGAATLTKKMVLLK
jgi:plastocyanin